MEEAPGSSPPEQPAEDPTPPAQQTPAEPTDQGSGNSGIAAGYLMAGGLLVGLVIGLAIDAAFDTAPGWTIGCALVFVLAALYQVVKDALK